MYDTEESENCPDPLRVIVAPEWQGAAADECSLLAGERMLSATPPPPLFLLNSLLRKGVTTPVEGLPEVLDRGVKYFPTPAGRPLLPFIPLPLLTPPALPPAGAAVNMGWTPGEGENSC